MAFLKVYTNGEERTVFLGDDPVVFGRDMSCDVLLKDHKVSREHCVIEPDDGRWRVLDLQSGNGTRVNGEPVRAHVLAPDDVVEIGDAKVLFAGEGAAIVGAAPVAASLVGPSVAVDEAERPRRRSSGVKSSSAKLLVCALAGIGVLIMVLVWSQFTKTPKDTEERASYEAILATPNDAERLRLARVFRNTYPDSSYADEVQREIRLANERMRKGETVDGYDAMAEVVGLAPREALAKLRQMLKDEPANRHASIRAAIAKVMGALDRTREEFFGGVEREFQAILEKGEFARAREIWFFLRGDPNWEPIPDSFLRRIILANEMLENQASAERSRILEEEAHMEQAHDFVGARELLEKALPRFAGTSVAPSLRERLAMVERALTGGVSGKPIRAKDYVKLDTERQVNALLAKLTARDFRGAATGLAALAVESKKTKARGQKLLAARAREASAAATLHESVAAILKKQPPSGQIAKRWRVLAGGPDGLTVRSKGNEITYTWAEAPAPLVMALYAKYAPKIKGGRFGLAVVAHALGDKPGTVVALADAYENKALHPALNRFVAERVRGEAPPDGGYVVHAGAVYTRKAYLRKQEEERIAHFHAQLDKAYAGIKADTALKKLAKLAAQKGALDKARTHALELIFDEKKYFYPYRGSGRMGEYTKVQQEVDQRVAGVRAIWDALRPVSIKESNDIARHLRLFDEAASELQKRLVDIDEKVSEVMFLRAYFGTKFTVQSFFRTPDEQELLRYSREVMAFNEKVQGDITPVERAQVRITNEYRIMFGRWPVRLIENLVLSSRGHCEEMSRLGYFGHFSSTPGRRTPYDRMKLAGYTYGASENIIMGRTGPQAAHDGWCHSSGHHRNILTAPWTEMGTGHLGRYMCQNFGQAPKWSVTDPKPEPGSEDDDSGFDWEDDGCGCGCGDGPAKPEDDFDYDDEDGK